MYDYIFITLDSSFYKVNLYNELSKKMKILVIFLCKKNRYRSEDFLNNEKFFEYIYLSDNFYEERSQVKSSLKIVKILITKKYKRLVLGGWDSLENWVALMMCPKIKSCLVVESSEFESTNSGVKGILKKIFISKLSYGFASGESQKRLLLNLNFNGKIIKTKGVGIFNLNEKVMKETQYQKEIIKKFIFVGGLIPVKNLEQLIRVFNKLPELQLTVVGTGILEESLRKKAKKNILFLGHVANNKLDEIYQKNDVFILPSKSEPWGLVVEEALSNSIPVILSNKVGCSTEVIEDGVHGYIYDVEKDSELIKKIEMIVIKENYMVLKNNVKKIDFNQIRENQIKSYIIQSD